MKQFCSSLLLAAGALAVSSCGMVSSMNEPLSGDYNPLDPPGVSSRTEPVEETGPAYAAGQWLETSVPSAALYARVPRRGEQPYRTLAMGTPLKVISTEGTYVRVELESGDIGYVPSIMVAEKSSAQEIPIVPVAPGDLAPSPSYNPGIPYTGVAPEPEVAPLSVEDAVTPTPDTIDPGDRIIE